MTDIVVLALVVLAAVVVIGLYLRIKAEGLEGIAQSDLGMMSEEDA